MIFVDRDGIQLDVATTKHGRYTGLEIRQHHTNAQRPHWRRCVQINLTEGELALLTAYLLGAQE